MKFLRVGEKGKEFVAALDKNKKLRDLSSKIKDLNPETLNFKILEEIKETNLEDLKEVNSNIRIGSCITKPLDFLAIGLNYKAHADATKSKLPTEPILFNKSSGCIQGPNDPILKPKEANKMDYEVEVAMVIGKKGKYIPANKAQEYLGNDGWAEKFINYMHKGFYSLSSPIWSNFGRDRGLPISCFGSYIPDDMEKILGKIAEVGTMSKVGGGTSAYFGDVRPRGAEISSGGTATGVHHQLTVFDSLTKYFEKFPIIEYQGRKVKLGKPFRTPDGPKKFSVYVKNEKGNVVKVSFGDKAFTSSASCFDTNTEETEI